MKMPGYGELRQAHAYNPLLGNGAVLPPRMYHYPLSSYKRITFGETRYGHLLRNRPSMGCCGPHCAQVSQIINPANHGTKCIATGVAECSRKLLMQQRGGIGSPPGDRYAKVLLNTPFPFQQLGSKIFGSPQNTSVSAHMKCFENDEFLDAGHPLWKDAFHGRRVGSSRPMIRITL